MQPGKSLLAVLSCVLVLAAGCKSKPAAPAGGLIPITLQTDWYPQPEMGGFYQAQLQGLYKAEGLDVTIAPGGPVVVAEQQVASGAAEFAMSSSDKIIAGVSRGLPLVAIAATMQQDPQGIMVHEESPIHTFADLDGHTVAIKPGSTWFQYLLSRFDLKNVREIPATYSVANFLQDPNYIQQAFVTSEPYFARKGGAQVRTLLVSSTGYQPYRVMFTSRAYLAAHPDIAEKFVRASLKGWQNYMQDPTLANAAISKANPAMSADWMRFSLDTLKEGHFIEGTGTPDSHLGHFTAERWATISKQLDALKVTAHPIDPTTAYTTQFVP